MIIEDYVKSNIKEIIDMAVSNVSKDYDTIVYYNNVKEGLFVTHNEFIGWDNLVEVYRLNKGFECYEVAECMDCDHLYTCDNNWTGDGENKLIECTINKLLDKFSIK